MRRGADLSAVLRRRSLRDGGERPPLEHRMIPVRVARHDQVIEHRDAEDLPGKHEVFGRRDVLRARRRVPGGVVVPVLFPVPLRS